MNKNDQGESSDTIPGEQEYPELYDSSLPSLFESHSKLSDSDIISETEIIQFYQYS